MSWQGIFYHIRGVYQNVLPGHFGISASKGRKISWQDIFEKESSCKNMVFTSMRGKPGEDHLLAGASIGVSMAGSGCDVLRAVRKGIDPEVESQEPPMISRKPTIVAMVNCSCSSVTPSSTASAGLT